MNKEDIVLAYSQCFDASGAHIRDEASGIDVYIKEGVGKWLVVTLWGSTESVDWFTNFKFTFRKWAPSPLAKHSSPIRVHSGYMEGWMRVRQRVLALVSGSNVMVCGYSMGGGLSSIVAVDVQANLAPANLVCFDLDGPKVWNKAGQDSFNRRVPNAIKIKYGNDIVTKVPPFYRAGGTKLHLGPAEHWWKCSVQDHLKAQDISALI